MKLIGVKHTKMVEVRGIKFNNASVLAEGIDYRKLQYVDIILDTYTRKLMIGFVLTNTGNHPSIHVSNACSPSTFFKPDEKSEWFDSINPMALVSDYKKAFKTAYQLDTHCEIDLFELLSKRCGTVFNMLDYPGSNIKHHRLTPCTEIQNGVETFTMEYKKILPKSVSYTPVGEYV